MAEPRTRPTSATFASYLANITDEERRTDCEVVADLMQFATGQPPVLWGPGIVGFGRYIQQYANGREADWPVTAFSSRKTDLTLYIKPAQFPDVLAGLGNYKLGGSCLYIRALDNIDLPTLAQLIALGVERMSDDRVD